MWRRFGLAVVLTSATVSAQEFPQTIQSSAGPIKVTVVANGLQIPWGVAFMPNGSALISERPGTLKRWDRASGLLSAVSGVPKVHARGQGGLLDVQLHPQFAQNARVYLCYAVSDGDTNTTELGFGTLDGNALKDFKPVFRAAPEWDTVHHFGCRMQFARDGKLFLTIGDRLQRDLAQDLDNHMGKLLRLNDDGTPAKGNPFASNPDAKPEIFSIGHRNPQGLAIDPNTGAPWLNEHGPRGGDEINAPIAGKNYGWPVITFGREYHGPKIGEGTAKPGLEQPIYQWTPSIGPSGLMIYRGDKFTAWKGSLFSGALALEHLNRIPITDGKAGKEERLLEDQGLRVRDVEQDAEGFIYLLTDVGLMLRLAPG
jgi:aldose sugar dehydrogenase